VRQRPGPKNALGSVKFSFPNDEAIYLHGTPATALFDRTRRDFSHGCVRVERPAALAQWVLGEQSGWTLDRIRQAMEGRPSQRVQIPSGIRVVLFYTTAAVFSSDGALHFADDIYGHDRRLDAALRRAHRP
jgi:murein L,D-transpeptidase YcbB/YkuD